MFQGGEKRQGFIKANFRFAKIAKVAKVVSKELCFVAGKLKLFLCIHIWLLKAITRERWKSGTVTSCRFSCSVLRIFVVWPSSKVYGSTQ